MGQGCDGAGRVEEDKTLSVKIPAGVSTGNRVHLDSQGEVGPGGGPSGDLYVELSVSNHDVFKRDGDNLEMVAKLPMTAAALGTEVWIDTLEADVEGTVPEEFRGIGVRIEDDIVVTADGAINMSVKIHRTADAVEQWVQAQRKA